MSDITKNNKAMLPRHLTDNQQEDLLVARLRAVERAWHDEGINPEYHRAVKRHLKIQWPTLYRALTELVE